MQSSKPKSVTEHGSVSDARRKREKFSVEIRRRKRFKEFVKKRVVADEEKGGVTTVDATDSQAQAAKTPAYTNTDVLKYLNMIMSTDKAVCLEGITRTRSLLSLVSPPFELVLSHPGVIDRLITLLDEREDAKFLLEVCWCLTNLASGNDTPSEAIIQAGVVEKFASILHCQDMPHNVVDQVVWCLGNIAGDGPEHRDTLIDTGFVPLLANLATRRYLPLTLQQNLAWTISNFCRGQPIPSPDAVRPFMQPLGELLYDKDTETVMDACWAFSYISDYGTEEASKILEMGLHRILLELSMHPSVHISTPALRTVGNIVASYEVDITPLTEAGLLTTLKHHLSSIQRGIRKEACWVLSNLGVGSSDQRQLIIQSSILPCLIPCLTSSAVEVRKEAIWAVGNCLCAGEADIIAAFLAHGVVDALVVYLSKAEDIAQERHIRLALDALEHVLEYGRRLGQDVNPVAEQVIESGGIDVFSTLQSSPYINIYFRSIAIQERFFDVEDA